jgi:cystathionine beta-lyase
MAPSKTFNVAGLFNSSIIIKNKKLREQFVSVMESLHLVHSNVFAMTASEAAYADGDKWVDEMMAYVKGNFDLLENFFKTELPVLSLTKPEATFLAWIDFSKTGLSNKKIRTKLVEEAGLGLSPGTVFGDGGSGFMRMNLGCPQSVVTEALEKLKSISW